MKTTSIPIYRRVKEGKVLMAMTLDHRNGTDKAMPVCIRVAIGTLRRYFLMPGERYTLEEFSKIINGDNRRQGPKRKEFRDDIEIKNFSGNQKWLLYCLERFLNNYDK